MINKDKLIDIGFHGGLGLKAVNALVEFIGGFLAIVVSHNWLNNLILLIALPELSQDPHDPLMNSLVIIGQNFSSDSEHSLAIYMLLHGITKLVIIWLLWEKKLWAYLPAVFVFGLFIAYELYSCLHNQSLFMLFIVLFDIAIVVMIILEYKHLKKGYHAE